LHKKGEKNYSEKLMQKVEDLREIQDDILIDSIDYVKLGLSQIEAGERTRAYTCFIKALNEDPTSSTAAKALNKLSLKQSDLELTEHMAIGIIVKICIELNQDDLSLV